MTDDPFLHRTRAAYDAMAGEYAEAFQAELADKPLDRALLAAFAEVVREGGAGPVADIGCGPGHVTAHLAGLGLTALGIDLSPEMIAVARRTHPDLRFAVGSMTALDLPDGSLGGIVAFYSIIHVPTERLPGVFAEFHRVLAPGGHLLLAFQSGDDGLHRTEAFGHEIALDYTWRRPDDVAALLTAAGLPPHAHLLRDPTPAELLPRAYLQARKPSAPTAD